MQNDNCCILSIKWKTALHADPEKTISQRAGLSQLVNPTFSQSKDVLKLKILIKSFTDIY